MSYNAFVFDHAIYIFFILLMQISVILALRNNIDEISLFSPFYLLTLASFRPFPIPFFMIIFIFNRDRYTIQTRLGTHPYLSEWNKCIFIQFLVM